jgi:2-methylisocitrate lyase-like PEP mutase family enzyme
LASAVVPLIVSALKTGYGNAVNVKRTVSGYARAGMAGIMIEDQVAPKRCGHVAGKSVVPFDEAVQRVKAACDARYVSGAEVLRWPSLYYPK